MGLALAMRWAAAAHKLAAANSFHGHHEQHLELLVPFVSISGLHATEWEGCLRHTHTHTPHDHQDDDTFHLIWAHSLYHSATIILIRNSLGVVAVVLMVVVVVVVVVVSVGQSRAGGQLGVAAADQSSSQD